jgi:hypothetical protein
MNQVKMNKVELYNKIVEVYKKTGQGVPSFIKFSIGQDVINELVEDGLIKIVVQQFNYLPDDEKLCVTKGYCVEDDYMNDKNSRALDYIRMYLNHDPVIDFGSALKVTLKQAFSNVDLVKGYAVWLEKNKKALDEMENIQFLDDTSLELNEELIDYIKTRDFYKENKTISVSLSLMLDADTNILEQITLTKEILNLMKSAKGGVYNEKIKIQTDELYNYENELKKRHRIENYLASLKIQDDENNYIQDFIN